MKKLLTCLLLITLLALPALSLAQAPFATGFVEGEALAQSELSGLVWSEQEGLTLSDGQAEGVYTSPEIDVQPFEYAILSWNADTPAGASLEVGRFRHREAAEWTLAQQHMDARARPHVEVILARAGSHPL